MIKDTKVVNISISVISVNFRNFIKLIWSEETDDLSKLLIFILLIHFIK